MSVSMKPGATAFTVMLREPISWASALVSPIRPGFGRDIIGLARIASFADHRGDIDDPAPALRIMPESTCWMARERARQVGLDHRVPVVGLHAQGETVARDGGVVDQNVDAAELFRDFRERLFDGIVRGHVDRDQNACASGARGFPRRLLPACRACARRALRVRPRAASARAQARPMPRLAPVTNAIRFVMLNLQ